MKSLWFGLTLPLRALGLIVRHPPLILASLVPWLLSVALDAWLIHRFQVLLAGWIHAHLAGAWEWVASALAWAALLIAGVLAFSLIAGIAALPFNDYLAELAESRMAPPLPAAPRVSWSGKARHLSIDLFKTLCAMVLSVVALLMSWVPVLNVLGIVLALLLVAFQFLSYPQTRRGQGLAAGARFVALNFWSCLGFGASFSFLFALPLVSSLALPLAVVGGTMLFARGDFRP